MKPTPSPFGTTPIHRRFTHHHIFSRCSSSLFAIEVFTINPAYYPNKHESTPASIDFNIPLYCTLVIHGLACCHTSPIAFLSIRRGVGKGHSILSFCSALSLLYHHRSLLYNVLSTIHANHFPDESSRDIIDQGI